MNNASFSFLVGNWKLILLRGILGIALGGIALLWPLLALFSVVILYGAFVTVDGALALWASFDKGAASSARSGSNRWWLIIVGVLGIFAGLIMLFNPVLGAAVLVFCVGLWCIFRGVLELLWFFRLRGNDCACGWLLLDALVSLIFGVLVVLWPGAAAVALTWGLGVFALLTGFIHVSLALKLRKAQ